MNSDKPNLAGSLPSSALPTEGSHEHHPKAYETSLISQYARFLLLLVAVPLLIAYLQTYANHRVGLLPIVANICLIGSLLVTRGNSLLRLILLGCLTLNIAATMIHSVSIVGVVDNSINANINWILLVCLVVACFFETNAALKSVSRSTLFKMGAWGILAIPVLVYVAVIPSLDALQQVGETDTQKLALRDPNWNLLNEITFRAAKFLIFGAFAYLGACLGSFLNVVAASVPRGKSVAWRDSRCPQCNSKISRIDNIPIFSFINLGGRCRNCHVSIPMRYLIVECLVAGIFGSLFLYELVTGGANVPVVRCRHEGILWIILYPKWHIIGLVLLHAAYMSFVLVLALIEWDDQPLKTKLWAGVSAAFFLVIMLYLPLQPIPLFEHLPNQALSLPRWGEQLLKLLVGGGLGVILGAVIGKAVFRKQDGILTVAFFITGMVLGWQALIQITLLFGVLQSVFWLLFRNYRLGKSAPTAVLLITVLLHHPFWKMFAEWWN